MKARWKAVRAWSPTFPQELAMTIFGIIGLAFMVGTALGAGLTKLVTRH
jgi:hypothetical protein